MVRSFQQEKSIGYVETFAFVIRPMRYQAVFAIAASKNWSIYQINVRIAYMYSPIEREFYFQQHREFDNITNKVYKLN